MLVCGYGCEGRRGLAVGGDVGVDLEGGGARAIRGRGILRGAHSRCPSPNHAFFFVMPCMLHTMPSFCRALQPDVVALAAFYEHRLSEGQKSIFHLEAFVAKLMASYRQFVLTMFE